MSTAYMSTVTRGGPEYLLKMLLGLWIKGPAEPGFHTGWPVEGAAEPAPGGLGHGQLILIEIEFSVNFLIEGLDDRFNFRLEDRKSMLETGPVLIRGFARRAREAAVPPPPEKSGVELDRILVPLHDA